MDPRRRGLAVLKMRNVAGILAGNPVQIEVADMERLEELFAADRIP